MPITLITGCSSGIGLALARALRVAGHEVWATARKEQDVAELQAEGFIAHKLDVNDELDVLDLFEALFRRGKGLDVLINNAGYGAIGPLLDSSTEQLARQFNTNVVALVGMTRAFFPLLRLNRGLVVNIGSVSGVLVTPFAGAYCASKAAVHAISEALRLELAPFNVRVLEVQPGAIGTHFADNASLEAEQAIREGSAWWAYRENIRARARASQNRPTRAEDFAQALVLTLQKPKVPRLVRIGRGSFALPLLAWLLPKGLLAFVLRRQFGLDRAP